MGIVAEIVISLIALSVVWSVNHFMGLWGLAAGCAAIYFVCWLYKRKHGHYPSSVRRD